MSHIHHIKHRYSMICGLQKIMKDIGLDVAVNGAWDSRTQTAWSHYTMYHFPEQIGFAMIDISKLNTPLAQKFDAAFAALNAGEVDIEPPPPGTLDVPKGFEHGIPIANIPAKPEKAPEKPAPVQPQKPVEPPPPPPPPPAPEPVKPIIEQVEPKATPPEATASGTTGEQKSVKVRGGKKEQPETPAPEGEDANKPSEE